MRNADGAVEIYVNAAGDGLVTGMVEFEHKSYTVTGQWAAAGSVKGRNYSAFTLSGSDGRSAPEFIAAAGTMKGPGNAPETISLNLIRTDSTDGLQYGWDGELKPEYV